MKNLVKENSNLKELKVSDIFDISESENGIILNHVETLVEKILNPKNITIIDHFLDEAKQKYKSIDLLIVLVK